MHNDILDMIRKMEMEVDSQDITPPSSPIFGYSKLRDDELNIIDSGLIFCLDCKGAPRSLHDFSFSAESYILRNEVVTALEVIRSTADHLTEKPRLVKCFKDSLFDPLDKEHLKLLIRICRKTIDSLEVLAESSHTVAVLQPGLYSSSQFNLAQNDPDELGNQNPGKLRRNTCHFLNVVLWHLKYYTRRWKQDELDKLFVGLKKSLPSVQEWSSVLKNHCGFKSGNECQSATYHFFHLQWELRWSLLRISGGSPQSIEWILSDLIQLSWCKYDSEFRSCRLDSISPFNCLCVKEIWTMVRVLVDDLKPAEKSFWDYYSETMKSLSTSFGDPFFSMWLTANLAQISGYTVAGVLCSQRWKEGPPFTNGFPYLRKIFKDWSERGGKSVEVLRLASYCFQYWGGDCDIMMVLWNQWVPRLDRADAFKCGPFASVEKWLALVSKLYEPRSDASEEHDAFIEFLRLLASYAKECDVRDVKRLRSNIFLKLSRIKVCEFGELGIIRVSTLFLVFAALADGCSDVVEVSDRWRDLLYAQKTRNNNCEGRRKTIHRASCSMITILLRKGVNVSNKSVVQQYMKELDEIFSQSGAVGAQNKDLWMIYFELLDSLPKLSFGNADLGRDSLISLNLLMWLSSCGPNYAVRAFRTLTNLTSWVLEATMSNAGLSLSGEPKRFFLRLADKSLPFLRVNVLLGSNRIPSTDMEPDALLAADITILMRKFSSSGGSARDECATQFDLFALNERTCPNVSQHYVASLYRDRDFVENCLAETKWTQAWIRLLALDCSAPDELTELVIGSAFQSTSSRDLLRAFCSTGDQYRAEDIQVILSPLLALLQSVTTENIFKTGQGSKQCEALTVSVISSAVDLFRSMKFEKIYIKGVPSSCGHRILDLLVPTVWPGTPPWERFTPEIMKGLESNLFPLFSTVVSYSGLGQDPYLNRKLRDIVALVVFGFIKNLEDFTEDHPALKILNYAETQNVTSVQNQILPQHVCGEHVASDWKLSQRLVQMVSGIVIKRCTSLAIRLLPGIIRIFLIQSSGKVNMTMCKDVVIYCCQFGSSQVFRESIVSAFENVFKQQFGHRSKRVFDLCNELVKCSKPQVRKFLKSELLPLLTSFAEVCEQRRGIGNDNSLRGPLEMLRNKLNFMEEF